MTESKTNTPLTSEDATIPQEASTILSIGLYCLEQLHEQGHTIDLNRYSETINTPESPTGGLP